MPQRKRIQTNTVEGLTRSMQTASAKVEPTSELDEREKYYFKMIVSSRETESWMDNHRVLATNLAKTYSQIEELDSKIKTEGTMSAGASGAEKMSPAITAKTNLGSLVTQLNRSLGLMAVQNGLSGKAQDKRNRADADARAIISKVKNDDLLA
jgi:phage terminase small subunit